MTSHIGAIEVWLIDWLIDWRLQKLEGIGSKSDDLYGANAKKTTHHNIGNTSQVL